MTIEMPHVKQVVSPNYTATPIAHDLVIMHVMEGGYAGSVAWLCRRESQASVHLCMNEDGSEVTQLVPLSMKAWAQKAFNGMGISIEMPGFTAEELPEERWRAGAKIAAWICRAYAIPPVWARDGRGRGVCQHHDLGEAGGGHVDCSGVDSPAWKEFIGYVEEDWESFGDGSLPEFALHGLPNPSVVELPPQVTPELSHGGVGRKYVGDSSFHSTVSGFPIGSIADWQWRLKRVGANPSLGVDGDEGRAMRRAIGTFQRAVGLPVTNEINPATWAKLEEMA